MKITCISDLHGSYPKLPGGDLLIVAGDLTSGDFEKQYVSFFRWLAMQSYTKIVVIAGNHDGMLQEIPQAFDEMKNGTISYLCDSGTEFNGIDLNGNEHTIKIWGSPWSRSFVGQNPLCKAFCLDTEDQLAEKWALIPNDIDILVTHTPPCPILDEAYIWKFSGRTLEKEHVGSGSLSIAIMDRPSIKYHVFGHIHLSYGTQGLPKKEDVRAFINAAHMNEDYEPINPPITFEI